MSVQGKRPASGHPENPQAKRLHTGMTPNPIPQQNSNLSLPCSEEELERLNKEIHLKVQELYGTILSNSDDEQRAEDVDARYVDILYTVLSRCPFIETSKKHLLNLKASTMMPIYAMIMKSYATGDYRNLMLKGTPYLWRP